jgi:aspartate/methionine/tyrosine aminotransferase
MDDVLSHRMRRILDGQTLPRYVFENLARRVDAWSPVDNPDGYIALCTAENKLVSDLVLPRLRRPRHLPESALGYDDMVGNSAFRQTLTRFLADHVVGRHFDPNQLIVLSGAGSVLEALFYAIADPGDGVLVPTPGYPGFWPDLQARDQLTIVGVPTRPDDGFSLSVDLLDEAFETAGRPIRALLFTTPNNPLGRVYEPEEIDAVATWCAARGIHAVFDEVYALSVFGDRRFTSVAERLPALGERVHIVWAFSKDFGMSGLRSGVLVSENQEVLNGVAAQAYWASTPGDTQFALNTLLNDTDWLRGYLAEMPRRLAGSYRVTTEALDRARIPHLPSEAGFFLLIDLRGWLPEPTWAAEDALWRQILEETNVNLTPGSTCRIVEPGFFRLCFAAEPPEAVEAAVRRIAELRGRRKR